MQLLFVKNVFENIFICFINLLFYVKYNVDFLYKISLILYSNESFISEISFFCSIELLSLLNGDAILVTSFEELFLLDFSVCDTLFFSSWDMFRIDISISSGSICLTGIVSPLLKDFTLFALFFFLSVFFFFAFETGVLVVILLVDV